jgi:hypothetical protein
VKVGGGERYPNPMVRIACAEAICPFISQKCLKRKARCEQIPLFASFLVFAFGAYSTLAETLQREI